MSIVLMTTNERKIIEFRQFFSRYAQTLLVENPTESPTTLTTWLQTAKAILADESNIFDPEGNLVDSEYIGQARNICRLHAWVLKNNLPVRMSYIREVEGNFDGNKLQHNNSEVFGWDSAFTPIEGLSLHDMATVGLKNSAREQCLSAFAKNFLHSKEPKKLRWTSVDGRAIIDWNTNARLLLNHPLYQNLSKPLQNTFNFVVNQGIFFRSALSRRDGNYWFPGLNGGVPYVPKSDPIHEGTYMFHDLMHQLMPDLVFDGTNTQVHKHTYIAYRMMSEAISLVFADMHFVDCLANNPTYKEYDFSTRQIYPFFQTLDKTKREDLHWLLHQMVKYVLLGKTNEFPTQTKAWQAFEGKYARFFIADFQWTRMNWLNLVGRTDMARRWIELIHTDALHAQGIFTVSDFVTTIGWESNIENLVEYIFKHILEIKVIPALKYENNIEVSCSISNGFRRWLTGQCALFARYAPIISIPPFGYKLAERIRDSKNFTLEEMAEIREEFTFYVKTMTKKGLISDDDATVFSELFPLFDPFFLKDYDRSEQEFKTIVEASTLAFS